MAIKVGGTTVIDDSRNLSNVGGLKTVNGSSLVGSGNISAGANTGFNQVGTYAVGRPNNQSAYNLGATSSGVKAVSVDGRGIDSLPSRTQAYGWNNNNVQTYSLSGTWRSMTRLDGAANQYSPVYCGIWVRIS